MCCADDDVDHLDDLGRQHTPAFPYVWDGDRVLHMLEFFSTYLTLDDTDDTGQALPFRLVRWLQFAFGSLLGWVHQDTGHLRFVEAYLEATGRAGAHAFLPKGNAKAWARAIVRSVVTSEFQPWMGGERGDSARPRRKM